MSGIFEEKDGFERTDRENLAGLSSLALQDLIRMHEGHDRQYCFVVDAG